MTQQLIQGPVPAIAQDTICEAFSIVAIKSAGLWRRRMGGIRPFPAAYSSTTNFPPISRASWDMEATFSCTIETNGKTKSVEFP